MNKTLKLFFAIAGSILSLGFIGASFIGGMLFWRFRSAVQLVQAANYPLVVPCGAMIQR